METYAKNQETLARLQASSVKEKELEEDYGESDDEDYGEEEPLDWKL